MGGALLGLFILLLACKIPIALALAGSAFFGLVFFGDMPPEIVFHRMTGGLDSFVLLAIPFFIFAGNLMNTSGITRRIFHFAQCLVGRIPGGLAHANVVASIIFSGMSGSAVADAGGLGLVEMNAMKDQGYEPKFAAAVTAASATIGPIIPPSIPMVVYGVMAEVSIGALFLGGMIPGVLMGLTMMVLIYVMAIKRNYPRSEQFHKGELWKSFKDAFLALLAPVIIIGGILGGFFTPTEAAAVAVIYALFLGIVIYRELSVKLITSLLIESLITTASVTLIISAASGFAWLIAIEGIPTKAAALLTQVSSEKWIILLIFNVFFLIIGTFMEALSVMVITVPVLVPIMKIMQFDPLHMGVVLVLNLMIGLITPPIGMSLFVTSKVGGVKLEELCRAVIPFIIPLVLVLFLITYVPECVTWLPRLVLQR